MTGVVYTYDMFSGRVGRLGFLAGTVYLQIPLTIIVLAYSIKGNFVGLFDDSALNVFASTVLFSLGAIWSLVAFFIALGLAIRRFQDMGTSGLFVLLFLVPFLNIFAWIALLVLPGDKKKNQYGSPVSSIGVAQVLFPGHVTSAAPQKEK